MALLCAVCRTPAAAISTSATSTYVIDVDSGRVLYENNADEERPIASITKIMTALVAIEASTEEDLAQVCTVSAYAASVGGAVPCTCWRGMKSPSSAPSTAACSAAAMTAPWWWLKPSPAARKPLPT